MDKRAEWIWYDGDFELHHHMKLCLSRRERGNIVPAFWKVFDCHRLVRFFKKVTLEKGEYIHVTADGDGYLMMGFQRKSLKEPIYIDKGEHVISIIVGNACGIPAVRVQGETIFSDGSWLADALEGGNRPIKDRMVPVGSMVLPEGVTPTNYELPVERLDYVSVKETEKGQVYDFGRETYVKLVFDIPAPGCPVKVVYGESMEEVMSDEHAVIREDLPHTSGNVVLRATACRYVRIASDIKPEHVYGLYEYLPLETRGSFESSDPLINRIYEVSEYTLRLNSRLFYLDGIKRDGWVWGGDAYQSFFFNYYCHYDRDIIKRTLIALRGGDPIVSHVNTIVDYSLYWLISLGDYSLYTGDHEFIRRIYDRAERLMAYCEAYENEYGLLQGREGDWTFIDWADMEKHGALCAMQMLYCKALEAMAKCAGIAGKKESADRYASKAKTLRRKIHDIYWNKEQGAYVTTFDKEAPSSQVRRHANIFALIFGFADEEMKEQILKNVIFNDSIPAITTPYFKFFELEALCKVGNISKVTDIIRSYWGGMLEEGATSFWEEYDPKMKGAEHYAMYGEPFDKSLCHAWGASPLYLLGRYYLGVYPVKDGYEEFEVRPMNGGLERISGTVPTMKGSITVTSDKDGVTVYTDLPGGWFVSDGKRLPIIPRETNTFKAQAR
ncbi:MAG: MGH1-like glycoside hydrolase domain-containing protein [Clostridia bacterium]|jgi:alpha-L-rhamnosidase